MPEQEFPIPLTPLQQMTFESYALVDWLGNSLWAPDAEDMRRIIVLGLVHEAAAVTEHDNAANASVDARNTLDSTALSMIDRFICIN